MNRRMNLDDLPAKYRAQALRQIREGTKTTHEVDPEIAERAWQDVVTAEFKLYGWLTYHTFNSRKSTPGFPDLVAIHPTVDRLDDLHEVAHGMEEADFLRLLRIRAASADPPGRVIVAELKREGKHPTPEQRIWLAAFAIAGIPAYLWRPSDLPEVQKVAQSVPDGVA